MEIKSYAPSFGMAFIRPKASQMEDFKNYLMKPKAKFLVETGLRQLRRAQAKNKHFDILYGKDNSFVVIPKSDMAKTMYKDKIITKDMGNKRNIDLVYEEIKFDEKLLNFMDADEFTRFKHNVVNLSKLLKEAVNIFFHPIETLPKNFRYANEVATKQAKTVEKQILKQKTLKYNNNYVIV